MDGLRFVLYDHHEEFRRAVTGAEATADIVPNAISAATFTLDDDHPALGAVTARGARCAVWFRGGEVFRGRVQQTPGFGPTGQVTAHVQSDMRKLWDWQGRQSPTTPIAATPTLIPAEYRVYTGAPESVFKQALAENFARLGVPWSVAPDLGRGGAPVRVEFRMHPLADKLMPILDAAGLLVVLTYGEDGEVVVDVREPATVPGRLTLASGVPSAYEFNTIAPTVTRAVAGGRGEGVERSFVEVIDTARESTWGDIIEGFVDARNTEEGADISVDAREALAEGAPRASITTELTETDAFRYRTTFEVGDLVRTVIDPVDIEQRISVSITETASGGVIVTPLIGDVDASSDTEVQLARQVERLARGARDQGRR
jgi:hypothetical protein